MRSMCRRCGRVKCWNYPIAEGPLHGAPRKGKRRVGGVGLGGPAGAAGTSSTMPSHRMAHSDKGRQHPRRRWLGPHERGRLRHQAKLRRPRPGRHRRQLEPSHWTSRRGLLNKSLLLVFKRLILFRVTQNRPNKSRMTPRQR
jgi:hypothetical protein